MAVLIDAHSLEEEASLLTSANEFVAPLDFSSPEDHDLKMVRKVSFILRDPFIHLMLILVRARAEPRLVRTASEPRLGLESL